MALLNQRLDSKIERGAERSVVHPSRIKAYSIDGKLTQSFPSGRLRHNFDISLGVRSRDEYLSVLGTFYVVMGTPYGGLRFKDWADYKASRTNTSLTSLGSGNWQLNRIYAFGAYVYTRTITRPTAGVVIYDAGGGILAATINEETGVAAVTGAPATWAGEFDVPVTFKDNEWSATLEVHTDNLHLAIGSILLEEVFE